MPTQVKRESERPAQQFTPGPWKVVGTEIWAGHRRIAMGNGAYDEKDRAVRNANARLIAASPAMYEALRVCAMKLRDVADWLTAYADPKQARSVEVVAEDAEAALALALGGQQAKE